MKTCLEYLAIILLCISTVLLVPFQLHSIGFVILLAGFLTLFLCRRSFAKELSLLFISVAILGFTPINTNISIEHVLEMALGLGLAVMLPYLISRYIYNDYLVRFNFHHKRKWYKAEITYIFVTLVIAYLLLPFFLKNTGSYLNWTVLPGAMYLMRLFIGTNALGIWDELFFISTALGILQRHFPFCVANVVQGIMFTSFLYELGFRGWGFLMIFIFSLIQGYIFKKTESLFYVITIHLTLDFILYFALINAYYPTWMPIFITS